jgi:hypothetical protein
MHLSPENKSVENLLYPDWQKPYQQAVLELDAQQLKARITAAEMAIANRLQAMNGDANTLAERRAIDDALSLLRALRRSGH